ncbi:MAG: ABC transporter ATP-binding protein/permease [Clostridia bacterium]|nr:ABC transporter ATP-binding protein/permease [Clostridia bacterium]
MLRISNISKTYVTGDLVQKALDGVDLQLRDNEFVAVLGPSGSGKTTLLNIIGGLDRYDCGDLVINGISTKKYKDRDWDSYRNHTIGFVFQSYNLIPHQSVLSNVELALTISGISKKERRKRAVQALVDVGLGDQIHKRPNQLSGGQMQRVAIARALVNDPEILLADEPTGALDSDTSTQVMELLKAVAKDHLVVMVTHNPELAEKYATRTINLRDGKIVGDSRPYDPGSDEKEPEHKNMGRASMSPLTALSLSFNNLLTKKARTVLTAFAGSIGIIGIALILSLSNGVNTYITDIQKSTMTSYPITIDAQTIDLSGLMSNANKSGDGAAEHELDAVYSNGKMLQAASAFTSSITTNNLTKFKKYLDDENSSIHEYIGDSGIVYTYGIDLGVYTYDPDGELINTNASAAAGMSSQMQLSGSSMMPSTYEQLLPSPDGLVSEAVKKSYDVLAGKWPENYDEAVLVINDNNDLTYQALYRLGFIAGSEYTDLITKIGKGVAVEVPEHRFTYEQILEKQLYAIVAADRFRDNGDGTFTEIKDDSEAFKSLLGSALKLKIVGVIKPAPGTTGINLSMTVGYTKALTDHLISHTNESPAVTAQKKDPSTNVCSGLSFEPADDAQKIEDTKKHVNGLGISEKARLCGELVMTGIIDLQSLPGLGDVTEGLGSMGAMTMGETELAALLDAFMTSPSDEALISIYDKYVSSGSYDENMKAFGVVSEDAPTSVSIYVDTFENKDRIADCIKEYNRDADTEDKITYTDYVGLLMSSISTIINIISYVLIAFVAVSLVVSSIMIGIITYISVLERTKEIGILRAIGASKRNISQVFNAETFIVGLLAGLIGVGISALLLIPGNALIHYLAGSTDVNAILPLGGAVILVVLSVVLTLIGGLIPAQKASHKDPVLALRTE